MRKHSLIANLKFHNVTICLQVYTAAADVVDIAGYGAARNLTQAGLIAAAVEVLPSASKKGKLLFLPC